MVRFLNYLALATSIAVATIAAYFSVIGLATMFSGAKVGVIVMASTLEFAKLVTAAYLHLVWKYLNYMKYYLVTAVIVLMVITSLGIFGYLSRAHLEQTVTSGDYDLSVEIIEERKSAAQSKIDRLKDRITSLDEVLQTSRPQDRNYVNRVQTDEREQIARDIDAQVDQIGKYNEELLPLRKAQLVQKSEVGPMLYVAEAIYGEDADKYLDNAIRWVIYLIIFVFDPLAVLLLVTSTSMVVREDKPKYDPTARYVVQVPKNKVADFSNT